MKHANLLWGKLRAFRSVSPARRKAPIRAAPAHRARTPRPRWKPERFGPGAVFANDNGSENMPEAEERLASRGVTQYWARPKKPNDKPFVERLISALQRECLDYSYEPMCAGELHKVADARLDKCRHYRLRESLGFLTPAEHSAMLSVPVPKRAGSYRRSEYGHLQASAAFGKTRFSSAG